MFLVCLFPLPPSTAINAGVISPLPLCYDKLSFPPLSSSDKLGSNTVTGCSDMCRIASLPHCPFPCSVSVLVQGWGDQGCPFLHTPMCFHWEALHGAGKIRDFFPEGARLFLLQDCLRPRWFPRSLQKLRAGAGAWLRQGGANRDWIVSILIENQLKLQTGRGLALLG